MADNDDGEPGRGIVGADGAKGFAADAAIVDLFQIGAEQAAFAATGAQAQNGALARKLQIDVRAHGRKSKRETRCRNCGHDAGRRAAIDDDIVICVTRVSSSGTFGK